MNTTEQKTEKKAEKKLTVLEQLKKVWNGIRETISTLNVSNIPLGKRFSIVSVNLGTAVKDQTWGDPEKKAAYLKRCGEDHSMMCLIKFEDNNETVPVSLFGSQLKGVMVSKPGLGSDFVPNPKALFYAKEVTVKDKTYVNLFAV